MINPYSLDYDPSKYTNDLLRQYWGGMKYTREDFAQARARDKKRNKIAINIAKSGIIGFSLVSAICIGLTVYLGLTLPPSMHKFWIIIGPIITLIFTVPYAMTSKLVYDFCRGYN